MSVWCSTGGSCRVVDTVELAGVGIGGAGALRVRGAIDQAVFSIAAGAFMAQGIALGSGVMFCIIIGFCAVAQGVGGANHSMLGIVGETGGLVEGIFAGGKVVVAIITHFLLTTIGVGHAHGVALAIVCNAGSVAQGVFDANGTALAIKIGDQGV